jgi:hypothetical protein
LAEGRSDDGEVGVAFFRDGEGASGVAELPRCAMG